MSITRDPRTATPQTATSQAPPELRETAGGGPITPAEGGRARSFFPRRIAPRSRLEKIGFWVIVVAALGVLLLIAGALIPRVMFGLIFGFYTGLFAGLLTLLNLSRSSAWGNAVLGRKIFPVLPASDNEIIRLAAVNAALMFAFTFIFGVLAQTIGPFLGGLVVFALLGGAAVFYNRARSVIIKP
jgi:hypothetical protein